MDYTELNKRLAEPGYVTIISHRNPDGDALGSSLALSLIFKKLGHNCTVISPSEYPKSFEYLPEVEDIFIADLDPKTAKEKFERSDIIVCVDFNSLDRVDRYGEHIQFSNAYKILIDHHLDPEPFADFYFTNSDASSSCELVYDFFKELGHLKLIGQDEGDCLMTGIITDTGSFKYNTTARVYEIAADLKKLGVDDYRLNDLIYNSLSEKQLRLLGHCLKSRMEIIPEYSTGIIALNKYDYENYKIQRGDTEGVVNYILMMPHIKIAAFISQQPNIIKISLRSKGDISVQEIAQNHFNGGGHKNASGGYMHSGLRHVIETFKEVLPKYISKNESAEPAFNFQKKN
jgi:phosphoesterase RecJ-like protein